MNKAKILLLGPIQCGKTVIANILSEATETSGGEYHPTQGCRILEFEIPGVSVAGKTVNADVELWDVSGDHKFESCWPAIAKDTSGVILVFNPEQAEQQRELTAWYNYYVESQALRDAQCIVFAHKKVSSENNRVKLSGVLSQLTCVNTSMDEDGEILKREFKAFLDNLFAAISERREQEELTILNSR